MKQILMTVAKLSLVGALILWLVESGRLDFQQLKIFVDHPLVLVLAIVIWGGGFLLLGGYRWYILLRGLDIGVSYARILHFQLIGFFFNTAVPGAVGGDIVKAVYVIREQQSQSKTPTLLTVLLDRIIGLACLFLLAGVAVACNASFFLSQENLRPLALFVGVGVLGLLIAGIIVFYPHGDGSDPVERLLAKKIPGFPLLSKIYQALRSYRHKPWILFAAVGLSCVIQVSAMAFAFMVTTILNGQEPPIGVFSTIYPIGVMATAIPVAPGGIGVGHVAFEQLFALGGLAHGANVFNVTVLIMLALNLLGVIPYLLHRTKMPIEALDHELESA